MWCALRLMKAAFFSDMSWAPFIKRKRPSERDMPLAAGRPVIPAPTHVRDSVGTSPTRCAAQ